jgi:hypothetical protein
MRVFAHRAKGPAGPAEDFPTGAPVLIITDAACDVLRVRRDHAFLVPEGARLPFTPRGPVFRMS